MLNETYRVPSPPEPDERARLLRLTDLLATILDNLEANQYEYAQDALDDINGVNLDD